MQAYRVSAIGFGVGAGSLLLFSAAQAAERAHKIEVVEEPKKGGSFVLVKATDVQAFKVGEALGLMELPKGQSHMAELIEGGGKSGREVALVKACGEFHAAAEEATLQAAIAKEEAAKKAAPAAAAGHGRRR